MTGGGPSAGRAAAPVPLRARLAAGERLVGTFSLVPAVEIIEIVAVAGFDFVICDMEHGPYDLGSLRHALLAARARSLPVVVRVRDADPAAIGAVLDLGCDGVLVPQVASAEEARAVVAAARFTPEGERGAHPFVRAADYGADRDYFARAGRATAVMLMIEGLGGIAAAPRIARLPGVDALFLGPVDLSHAMGLPGRPDHPRVVAELERVARDAADAGTATAVFTASPEAVPVWWGRGVPVVACGVDTELVRAAFARAVATARGGDTVGGGARGGATGRLDAAAHAEGAGTADAAGPPAPPAIRTPSRG